MSEETKLVEINSFLSSYLANKVKSTERQARIALSHWEKFARQKPASEVKPFMIKQFIFEKRTDLKPSTLLPYLFHLAQYFGEMQQHELKELIMKEREKLRLEMKNKSPKIAIHHGILKMLEAIGVPRNQLLLRLLLWSEIPIGCLGKLKVKHFNLKQREYEILCNHEKVVRGVLYSDTPRIIEEIKKEENLGQDDDLIGINTRQIQNLIPKFAKEVEIPYKVTPLNLRQFAKNPARDMLIELYEKRHFTIANGELKNEPKNQCAEIDAYAAES